VRKRYSWKLKHRELNLGDRTLLMGVLNVTPDSFSDGGKYSDPDRAFARAVELEEEGADILDIGAESTKPGSVRISAAEELRRLIPVLKRLKDKLGIPISVDTYKAEVAERAFEYGVEIINDPSGLTFEPQLARTVSNHDGGLVLNHMRGRPETWAKLGPMREPVATIVKELEAAVSRARGVGIDKSRLVIDPGFGFGKRKEQNSLILDRLGEFAALDTPILVGPSRKSFLTKASPEESNYATAAAVAACILRGAHIIRVHDVRAMRAAADVADEILLTREG
jgi:dihydropteroate synthase